MSDYKQKYLKYKNKYIELKNFLKGGTNLNDKEREEEEIKKELYNNDNHISDEEEIERQNKLRNDAIIDFKKKRGNNPSQKEIEEVYNRYNKETKRYYYKHNIIDYSLESLALDIKQIIKDAALKLCKKNKHDCENPEILKYYISYVCYLKNLDQYNDAIKSYKEKLPFLTENWKLYKETYLEYRKDKEIFEKLEKEKEEYDNCKKRSNITSLYQKIYDNKNVLCKKYEENNTYVYRFSYKDEKSGKLLFVPISKYIEIIKNHNPYHDKIEYYILKDYRYRDIPLSIEDYIKSLKKPIEPVKPAELKEKMKDYALSLCKKNNDDCNNEKIIDYYISYAYYEENLKNSNDNLKKYNEVINKYNSDIESYKKKLPVLIEEWNNKVNPIEDFFKKYYKERDEFDNIKKENQIKNKNEYNECTKRSINKRITDKIPGNSIICKEKVDESKFMSLSEYFKKLKDDGKINEEQYKNADDLINDVLNEPLSVEEYILTLEKPVKPNKFTEVEPVKPAELTKV